MRDIKFRCFYRNEMYFVDELYFHKDGSFGVGFIYMDGNMVSPDSEHVKGIMQFTGLKDKNGKEIYEGDVIQQHPKSKYFSWVVKYSVSYGFDLSETADYEVIGNIHENPELLDEL